MSRVFISVELPEKAKKEIAAIQKEIAERDLIQGKFTKPENLHLTLKFLGEISEDMIGRVREAIKQVETGKFRVEFDKVGVFNENFIRIIWLSLKGEELVRLQKEIDKNLSEFFPTEDRFMAHITIARPKFVEDKKKLFEVIENLKVEKICFEVDKFFLMESKLKKQGPEYVTLDIIELK
jgi:RNA 2',3'-cyclic 3'-phosphodiesterase